MKLLNIFVVFLLMSFGAQAQQQSGRESNVLAVPYGDHIKQVIIQIWTLNSPPAPQNILLEITDFKAVDPAGRPMKPGLPADAIIQHVKQHVREGRCLVQVHLMDQLGRYIYSTGHMPFTVSTDTIILPEINFTQTGGYPYWVSFEDESFTLLDLERPVDVLGTEASWKAPWLHDPTRSKYKHAICLMLPLNYGGDYTMIVYTKDGKPVPIELDFRYMDTQNGTPARPDPIVLKLPSINVPQNETEKEPQPQPKAPITEV